jgi:hypothetical protein
MLKKVIIFGFFICSSIAAANDHKVSLNEEKINYVVNLSEANDDALVKQMKFFLGLALFKKNGFIIPTNIQNLSLEMPTQPKCLSSKNLLDLIDRNLKIFEEPKIVYATFINNQEENYEQNIKNAIQNALYHDLPVLVKLESLEHKNWHNIIRFDNKKIEILDNTMKVIELTKDNFFSMLKERKIIVLAYTMYAKAHGYTGVPCNLL